MLPRLFLPLLLAGSLTNHLPLGAQTPIKEFPATLVDDVVVPVPSEIFSVLDKLGGANWKTELVTDKLQSTTDRTNLALMFGAVVAEGFIAVQAQDNESIKDLGKQVLDLATALGLKQDVQAHAQSILDAADKRDWKTIRKEFDRTQKTVRDSMNRMKDESLAQCVSLGGWIRGTSTASGIISRNYSDERADLLSQPFLVEHFTSQISKMTRKTRNHKTVEAIEAGLKQIQTQMPEDGTLVNHDGAKSIHAICAGLVKLIRNPAS